MLQADFLPLSAAAYVFNIDKKIIWFFRLRYRAKREVQQASHFPSYLLIFTTNNRAAKQRR